MDFVDRHFEADDPNLASNDAILTRIDGLEGGLADLDEQVEGLSKLLSEMMQ